MEVEQLFSGFMACLGADLGNSERYMMRVREGALSGRPNRKNYSMIRDADAGASSRRRRNVAAFAAVNGPSSSVSVKVE